MAFRTWGKPLLTALGVSVLAGAGQLGVAYGFGIVRLTGDFTDATVNRWPAQLVWVGWFAASAAVAGAVVTDHLARAGAAVTDRRIHAHEVVSTTTGRLRVAGAAALGATVVAPLCMQPARATELNGVDPVWAVGICAILGAVVGAGAALAVLLRPPFGWNMAMMASTIWLLALVSSLPALVGTGTLPTVRLGVFEPDWLGVDTAQRLATLVLPLVALLIGAASGALARRRGHPPLIGGACGAAGPVLVAFAYLTAGPGSSVDRYQLAPYYAALIAVATGTLGSTAAALLRWPLVARGGAADQRDDPPGVPGEDTGAETVTSAIEPTDILRPLATAPTTTVAGAAGGDDPAGPSAATARRVPSTVGDPLPHDPTGIIRDRAAAATPAESTPTGSTPTGGTPAHWEWPIAAGTVGKAVPPSQATAPRPADTAAPATAPAPPPALHVVNDEPSPTHTTVHGPELGETAFPTPDADPATEGSSPSGDAFGPGDGGAAGLVTPAPRPKRTRKPKGSTTPATLPATAPTDAADIGDPARATGPDATDARVPGRGASFTTDAGGPDTAADAARSAEPEVTVSPAATGPGAAEAAASGTKASAGVGGAPATGGTAGGPADAETPGNGGRPDAPADAESAAAATSTPHHRPRPAFFEAPSIDDVTPPNPPAPSWTTNATLDWSPPPVADGGTAPVDPAPRPRSRRPLPDLGGAASWDAFANSTRRAGPSTTDQNPAALPGSPPPSLPALPGSLPALGHQPDGSEPRDQGASKYAPADGGQSEHRQVDDGPSGYGPGDGDPSGSGPNDSVTATDTPETPGDEAEDPAASRSRLRRALFRRNRARAADDTDPTSERDDRREQEPLPAQDEEYVDWVTGLARPVPDQHGGSDDTGDRPLPTSGRHHRD
ncbi:hypothetical protein [Micromonospora sp. RTGN7]|uniref:hypothetical protein n=1 Tax=Micromonospora sp. RTGN7 TaxID=3016526 RepID=UPI0029FEE585|nr:hypothetical protein [Micromonospora sp. RTGN7]